MQISAPALLEQPGAWHRKADLPMQAQGIQDRVADLEEAVVRHILGWQPTILRVCDLVRELAKDPSDINSRNAVEEATRNLVEVGLLYRQGECVLPTVTLVYAQEMDI